MKKLSKIVSLSILTAIAFSACKKDDAGPNLNSNEKILTSKTWQLQSLTIPKTGTASGDSSIKPSCADSALVVFNISKVYQLANASKVACDSVVVPYGNGTWVLSAGGDSLTLKGKRNFIWKIITLNTTSLKATFRDSTAPNKNWLKTISFK